MQKIYLISVIFYCLISQSITIAQEVPESIELDSLSWLSGYWTDIQDNKSIEEIWLAPKDSLMLGMHREYNASGRFFYEFLRIEQTEKNIIYYAAPAGRSATPFRLVEISENRVVFENKTHDFPQEISYTLENDSTLLVQVGSSDKSIEWRWIKAQFIY